MLCWKQNMNKKSAISDYGWFAVSSADSGFLYNENHAIVSGDFYYIQSFTIRYSLFTIHYSLFTITYISPLPRPRSFVSLRMTRGGNSRACHSERSEESCSAFNRSFARSAHSRMTRGEEPRIMNVLSFWAQRRILFRTPHYSLFIIHYSLFLIPRFTLCT